MNHSLEDRVDASLDIPGNHWSNPIVRHHVLSVIDQGEHAAVDKDNVCAQELTKSRVASFSYKRRRRFARGSFHILDRQCQRVRLAIEGAAIRCCFLLVVLLLLMMLFVVGFVVVYCWCSR